MASSFGLNLEINENCIRKGANLEINGKLVYTRCQRILVILLKGINMLFLMVLGKKNAILNYFHRKILFSIKIISYSHRYHKTDILEHYSMVSFDS